jgi:hypothetical protein
MPNVNGMRFPYTPAGRAAAKKAAAKKAEDRRRKMPDYGTRPGRQPAPGQGNKPGGRPARKPAVKYGKLGRPGTKPGMIRGR